MNHRSSYWETGYFKKKNLRFVFPVNQPGLGDRFIMASNILFTMKEVEHESCIVDIFLKNTKTVHKSQYLNLIDFYDIIDFFHFKRPDESESSIITNIIDEAPPTYKEIFASKRKNITGDVACHDFNSRYNEYVISNYFLYNEARYWPINYDKTAKKQLITFMFYVDDSVPEHKFITTEEEKEFNKVKDYYGHYFHRHEYYFVRLEDFNYKRNIELLSKSLFLIASEGMWTHLSRAMKVNTIAYSRDITFIEEFNKQGHFCSGFFEKCLIELEKKCIELKKKSNFISLKR